MNNFTITVGDKELLDRIGPLWEELNAFHIGIGKSFSLDISKRTFDTKKGELIKSAVKMHIAIASEQNDVGYCVCTINSEGVGEIDSLYVKKEHRSKGLGRKLVEVAFQWMNENDVRKKVVVVLEGNAEAIGFYQSLGFLPRNIELEYMK